MLLDYAIVLCLSIFCVQHFFGQHFECFSDSHIIKIWEEQLVCWIAGLEFKKILSNRLTRWNLTQTKNVIRLKKFTINTLEKAILNISCDVAFKYLKSIWKEWFLFCIWLREKLSSVVRNSELLLLCPGRVQVVSEGPPFRVTEDRYWG